jgi:hypothetical protein
MVAILLSINGPKKKKKGEFLNLYRNNGIREGLETFVLTLF